MATGVQPTRKALPQLIPDGLPPELHLQAALAARHPLSYPPESTKPVEYALRYAPDDLAETRERRLQVCKLVRILTEACAEENDELLDMVEPEVMIVLTAFGTKNVALMRELAYVRVTRYRFPVFAATWYPYVGMGAGGGGLDGGPNHRKYRWMSSWQNGMPGTTSF